jgi:hypothetical protein
VARRSRAGRSPTTTPTSQTKIKAVRAWLVGILAAALATTLTGLLTGWFGAAGRKIADIGRSDAAAPGAAANISAEGPLTVAVQSLGVCGVEWVVPGGVQTIDTSSPFNVDMARSWRDWPPAANGATGAPHDVLIFVQGRSDAEVIITDLKVRVVERSDPPPIATVLSAQCGDSGAFRWLEVDLDKSPPATIPRFDANAAKAIAEEVPARQLTPIKFPYEVSISDAEPFLITAQTQGCDCKWIAEVSWASEGKTGTLVVNDDGKPFRSITTTGADGQCKVGVTGTTCE